MADRGVPRLTATRDETWLRVLDVRAALEARSFVGDGSVVVAVEDGLLQHDSGIFEISAHGVRPVRAGAQLIIGVAALAPVLLAEATWESLALAGLVEVHDVAALAAADALFGSWPAPHAGMYF